MKLFLSLNLPGFCCARTRNNTACKNTPIVPSLRCSKHGGKTPILHGKRTKYAQAMRRQAKTLRIEMKKLEKELASSIAK